MDEVYQKMVGAGAYLSKGHYGGAKKLGMYSSGIKKQLGVYSSPPKHMLGKY